MPRQDSLRAVFTEILGVEPPEWVEKIEKKEESSSVQQPRQRPTDRVRKDRRGSSTIVQAPPPPLRHSFIEWWCTWFGITEAPQWLQRLYPAPKPRYTALEFESGGEKEELSVIQLPGKAEKPPSWGDEWPTRRQKRLAKKSKDRAGRMMVTRIETERRFDDNKGCKVVVDQWKVRETIRIGVPTVVHNLDYRRGVKPGEVVFRLLGSRDPKTRKVTEVHGYLVSQGIEILPSQEAFLARAEQDEKVDGLLVTKGLKKPGWLAEGEWEARQGDPLFQGLNRIDWTPLRGSKNPDLERKFFVRELTPQPAARKAEKPIVLPARQGISRERALEIARKIALEPRDPYWSVGPANTLTIGEFCPQLAELAERLQKRKVNWSWRGRSG